ncbi:variable surface protein [Plasmodium gonderi]|uniref:Variable surface protein n=1 Tax=Plasmodium gonderi TaxID=77519 RepID=A0A1Y1JK53_PLAGO|nr:variable surface protein [Plasmodium gonderi]GAW80434.1 variable surface protein [Plasmodium gonderi]
MDDELCNKLGISNILKDLDANKIYIKLNSIQTNNTYDEYCKGISTSNHTNDDIKNLCYKLVWNMINLSTRLNDVNDNDKLSYVLYWLYDEIWKIYKNYKTTNVHDAFYNIVDLVYKINEQLNKYHYVPFTNYDLTEWKKEKYLHDYFKNFNLLKPDVDTNKIVGYCKYILHIINLYESEKENCCFIQDSKLKGFCNHYFNCDPEYNPRDLFNTLKCNNIVSVLAQFGTEKNSIKGDEGYYLWLFDLFTISKPKNQEKKLKTTLSEPSGREAQLKITPSKPPSEEPISQSSSENGSSYVTEPFKEHEVCSDPLTESDSHEPCNKVDVSNPATVENSVDGVPVEANGTMSVINNYTYSFPEPPHFVPTENSDYTSFTSDEDFDVFSGTFFRISSVVLLTLGIVFTCYYYFKQNPVRLNMKRRRRRRRRFKYKNSKRDIPYFYSNDLYDMYNFTYG